MHCSQMSMVTHSVHGTVAISVSELFGSTAKQAQSGGSLRSCGSEPKLKTGLNSMSEKGKSASIALPITATGETVLACGTVASRPGPLANGVEVPIAVCDDVEMLVLHSRGLKSSVDVGPKWTNRSALEKSCAEILSVSAGHAEKTCNADGFSMERFSLPVCT